MSQQNYIKWDWHLMRLMTDKICSNFRCESLTLLYNTGDECVSFSFLQWLNPSTPASVHHSSLSVTLHFCRFMHISLQASVFTTNTEWAKVDSHCTSAISHWRCRISMRGRREFLFLGHNAEPNGLSRYRAWGTFSSYNNGGISLNGHWGMNGLR